MVEIAGGAQLQGAPVKASASATKAARVAQTIHRTGQGTVDPNGVVSIVVDTVPMGQDYRVSRVTVSCTSTTPTVFSLYAGNASPANYRDGSDSGNKDVDDVSSPIHFSSGQPIVAVWEGASELDANGNATTAVCNLQIEAM